MICDRKRVTSVKERAAYARWEGGGMTEGAAFDRKLVTSDGRPRGVIGARTMKS